MDLVVLVLFLCGCELAQSFHRVIYEYHIIHLKTTWFEAQQHCRQHYTDLATFRDMDDINRFQRPGSFTEVAWIGLFDDPASWKAVMSNDSNSWRWSVTGTTSPGGYQNWWPKEPSYHSPEEMCALTRNGLWADAKCSFSLPSVCFKDSDKGPKQYFYVPTRLRWEEARSFCRTHHTDLAMIEDESENAAVASLLVTDQLTWIGLYRQPWRWSDGSDCHFTNWSPGQPDNYRLNQHCVWQHSNRWYDAPCSEKRKSICQRALGTETHQFTIKVQSNVDLSDPTLYVQLTLKLSALLQDKGLTDLRVEWKVPPLKTETRKKALDFEC